MSESILICGTNWLGDTIMSMPAVRLLREVLPQVKVSLLVKAGRGTLWELSGLADTVVEYPRHSGGTWSAVSKTRTVRAAKAYVFPNSFRSALIPFLSGIPERIGARGHSRAWMLSRVVSPEETEACRHQAWEYMAILGVTATSEDLEPPFLDIPSELVMAVKSDFDMRKGDGWVGVIPGAARGPSKRWPVEHFITLGRQLIRDKGRRIAVLGTAGEEALCLSVSEALGPRAVNLAGKTGLPELAAVLAACDVVVTNDSGGMHVAAAVGTPVVALFGMTDPAKTGPLGKGHRVMTAEGVAHSREIHRESAEAEACLRSIDPGVVGEAVEDVLKGRSHG